jgi:hypothetical protein
MNARNLAVTDMTINEKKKSTHSSQEKKRGRVAIEQWQARARYALRHLDDPIALQKSPLCRLTALERMAKAKYPNSVVSHGRTLNDIVHICLKEIEEELHNHNKVAKLKSFIELTRQGKGVAESSRLLGITPEYASRSLKRSLVQLLAEKLILRLH